MPVDPVHGPLLGWYDSNARVLPWRRLPGTPGRPDPYAVWLAEIMLQQTTVAAAGPYYRRFMALWPSVAELAAAPDDQVMREWAGLGYYARARNLLACARAVVARGGFPESESGLRELPGVGAYTAAAVAAIAFGRRAVVIDANVERVATRLFAISAPLPGARAAIHAELAAHVPEHRPGDFAQAMMDLGATLCTPRAPACGACPVREACLARAAGNPEAYPVKAAKKPRPLRFGTAWWIVCGGHVALVRRPPRGLLGGMPALPGTAFGDVAGAALPFPGDWSLAEPVRHGFTHFELELAVATVVIGDRALLPFADPLWTPVADIGSAGLPTLYAKAAASALALAAGGLLRAAA